jgi:hypothetical protein
MIEPGKGVLNDPAIVGDIKDIALDSGHIH